jgi:hypothetical protein
MPPSGIAAELGSVTRPQNECLPTWNGCQCRSACSWGRASDVAGSRPLPLVSRAAEHRLSQPRQRRALPGLPQR